VNRKGIGREKGQTIKSPVQLFRINPRSGGSREENINKLKGSWGKKTVKRFKGEKEVVGLNSIEILGANRTE